MGEELKLQADETKVLSKERLTLSEQARSTMGGERVAQP